MSYSLGVRRRGPDGCWAVVGVDEAILKCVVKCGLLRRCELDKLHFFLGHWRSCVVKLRDEPIKAPDDPPVAETVRACCHLRSMEIESISVQCKQKLRR